MDNQFIGAFGGHAGTYIGCTATGAGGSGFGSTRSPHPDKSPNTEPRWIGCQSIGSHFHGFVVGGEGLTASGHEMIACTATNNGLSGFKTHQDSEHVHLSNCTAIGNVVDEDPGFSFDIYGSDHVLQSCYGSALGSPSSAAGLGV